jgi:hypothetical protein
MLVGKGLNCLDPVESHPKLARLALYVVCTYIHTSYVQSKGQMRGWGFWGSSGANLARVDDTNTNGTPGSPNSLLAVGSTATRGHRLL